MSTASTSASTPADPANDWEPLLSETFTYSPPTPDASSSSSYPFYICAERLWTPSLAAHASNPSAPTLVFLHSTSFHKETWRPTVHALLRALSAARVPVRDALSIDCPNHGRSGALNAPRLAAGADFAGAYACKRYADAAAWFLTSPHAPGRALVADPRRPLIIVGHSLGGVAAVLLAHACARARTLDVRALVLVEPMLSPLGPAPLTPLRGALLKSAYERADVWRSRARAADFFRQTQRRWDKRVVELFAAHAVVPHPFAPETGLVTLACARAQEGAMYRDEHGPVAPLPLLAELCMRLPVHVVHGALKDMMPGAVHAALLEGPWRFASAQTLPGVGHLCPQQAPEATATAIAHAVGHTMRDRANVDREEEWEVRPRRREEKGGQREVQMHAMAKL